jgi:hypothetical protein
MYGRSGENAGEAAGNNNSSVEAGPRDRIPPNQVPAVINRPSVFASKTGEQPPNNNNNYQYDPDLIEPHYPVQQVINFFFKKKVCKELQSFRCFFQSILLILCYSGFEIKLI